MKKVLLIASVGMLLLMAFGATGCATAGSYQEKVLEKMPPNLRADYRDGLEDLAGDYDALYDRDGQPWPEPEPEPETP
jgi:hypothetical protein